MLDLPKKHSISGILCLLFVEFSPILSGGEVGLYGIISSEENANAIREAVGEEDIWFEKIGDFSEESFVQHCQSSANANVQTLIVDMSSTDDGSIIRGIQQFRLLRDSRIVVVGPGRVPGDTTITTLLGLQVLDIVAPSLSEDGGFDENLLAQQLRQQLAMKPSYGNVVRWDLKTAEVAQIKKAQRKEKARKEKGIAPIDPSLMDHIESIQIQPPLVKEKQTLVETIIGTVIIAVVGVEETAGCTHTALLVTHYLSKKGRRIAVIEANGSDDFSKIESAYQAGTDGYISHEAMFSIDGIDHYKSNYRYDIARLLELNYDYIILDLGSYLKTPYLEEFYRAHVQIVTGHGIEWRQSRLYEFSKTHEHRDQSKWIYAIPHVDEAVIGDIRKTLELSGVYPIPFHPDPYRSQKDTDQVLDGFLKAYIGRKRKKASIPVLYGIIAAAFTIIVVLIILLFTK